MASWETIRRGFGEFRRRRVFRALIVYVLVAWVLVQVADATFEPLGLPDGSARLLIVLLALGVLPVLALAWIYDVGPGGLEKTAPDRGASTAADAPASPPPAPDAAPVVSATGAPPATPAAPGASVAILPFADLSDTRDQDYFCDGLAEEIINALTRVRGLRVASRTSSFRFRGAQCDAREIGRLLGVAAIMEGSVRKSGERVRVTAQLIDADSGYHLWSQNFDRELEDVFVIQEEIARRVVERMRPTVREPVELDLQRYAPRDMRAYEFYLRGRSLEEHTTAASWRKAPQMFRRAIEFDPGYAHAHAGLADALVELLLWRLEPAGEVLGEAKAAAARALELAPELAEAHVAYAHVLSLEGRREAASASFEKALELDPTLYVAHYYFARHCFANGEYERAADLFESAHAADPGEFQSLALAVGAAEAAGDPQRAERLVEEGLRAALHHTEIDPGNARAHYLAAGLLIRRGEVEAGRREIDAALAVRGTDFDTLYNAACFHALAGEKARALELLERAVDTGLGFRDWIAHDSELESLHGDPRFQALLERTG